jgi:SHS2 domain-containing protein
VRYAFPQPYRDLEHTADVGVAVEGASAEEALALLVLAYAALLSGGAPVEVERDERIAVVARGGGPELAVALLRELLFRFAVERVLPGACEVALPAPDRAEVTVGLGRYDPERHGDGLDLKAVTRHAARFGREDDGVWRAQVVFDI